jgi:hypothetical protein
VGRKDAIELAARMAAAAVGRAQELRIDAAALRAEAHQSRRSSEIHGLVRSVALLERELRRLDQEIDQWDGEHPPLQVLTERLETVEAGLDRVESLLRELRPPESG